MINTYMNLFSLLFPWTFNNTRVEVQTINRCNISETMKKNRLHFKKKKLRRWRVRVCAHTQRERERERDEAVSQLHRKILKSKKQQFKKKIKTQWLKSYRHCTSSLTHPHVSSASFTSKIARLVDAPPQYLLTALKPTDRCLWPRKQWMPSSSRKFCAISTHLVGT